MKPYSDETASMIDEEVRRLVSSQFERAKQLLKEKRNDLEVLAQQLLEKEVVLKSDLERLIGKRLFGTKEDHKTHHNGTLPEREVPEIEQVEDLQ